MNIELSHVRLLVNNFQESVRFYKALLGDPVFLNDTYADFSAGKSNIALYCRSEMSKAIATDHRPDCDRSQQDSQMLIFSVNDVNSVHMEIKDICVVVTPPIDRPEWGVRTAHFRDPDGNLLEINQDL